MAEPDPARVGRRDGGGVDHEARLVALGATEAAGLIADGQISSEELTRACLARIDARDDDVRAWVRAPADGALAQARERDAVPADGPLHGVPFGVKDLVDTADLPTEYGSPIHAGHQPATDAVCVQRLVDAGGVVLGKTVTTEFALFHPGPTANPHDLGHTPGGSSSGSAAAVADRHVPLALGTQTAGSIVRPASFCGVWGYKPTFGDVPTAGVKPASRTLDTLGVFARDPADLAPALRAMGDRALGPGRSEPSVGFVRTHEWDRADVATREAVDALATEVGADEVMLPDTFTGLVAAQSTIMDAEVMTSLQPEFSEHRDELSDELRDMLERAARVDPREVHVARELAARCRQDLDEVFGPHDALLTPSVLGEAPAGLDSTGDPLLCRMWTLLGTPSVAVPGLVGPAGLPLGVQVVARPGADATALTAAIAIGHHLGPPPLPPSVREASAATQRPGDDT